MKTIPLVLTFLACASLAGAQDKSDQKKTTPSQELAAIVAVEEQERDLAKAETLYREALAGKALSDDARQLANMRLAKLLQRLGRGDEAVPFTNAAAALGKNSLAGFDDVTQGAKQDVEREQALREKARELVKQVVADAGTKGNQTNVAFGGLFGIDERVAEQLLWIGQAAVPEVIAVLQAVPTADSYNPAVVRSLAAFLWRVGGAKAEEFVRKAKDQERLRFMLAEAACALERPEMLAVAAQFLPIAEPGLSDALLDGYLWGKPLRRRFEAALLIDVLGQGSVEQRKWLLTWAGSSTVSDDMLPKLLAVVSAALASTEPSLGTAAQKLLMSAAYIQNSIEGTELLLEWLPSPLLGGGAPGHPGSLRTLAAADAARLLPKLDACIRGLGPVREKDGRAQWVAGRIHEVAQPLDASVVPTLLRWIDLGYDAWQACTGKVTMANAAEVFARFDRVQDTQKQRFLEMLAQTDLPADLFPSLLAKATEMEAQKRGNLRAFAEPMARTGNPAAAGFIWVGWQQASDKDAWAVNALVELGRRTQDERVRSVMRSMAAGVKGEWQSTLLLALLSMHDGGGIALLPQDIESQAAVAHPYASRNEQPLPTTPLEYLLHDQPNPPHGFSEDEQIAFVSGAGAWQGQTCASQRIQPRRVATRVVMALAEHSDRPWGSGGFRWQAIAAGRISEEAVDGPLHRWLAETLRREDASKWVFTHLDAKELLRIRPQLDAMLVSDDEERALAAFTALARNDLPLDLAQLVRSRHAEVASRALNLSLDRGVLSIEDAIAAITEKPLFRDLMAQYLGAKVAVDAVPILLTLLKDSDTHIRQCATEALTKIRFYHEQQAHWDRVLKGLDASPASAVEKLLLQAKPGAQKEQRLLAITSLGTLGVPEALPFLIEWTQDTDASIAKAAKDAITQIHLTPRK